MLLSGIYENSPLAVNSGFSKSSSKVVIKSNALLLDKKENEFDDVDNEMELEVDVDKANWEIYKESRIDNEMKMFENAKMNEKERINTKGEVGSKLKMKNKKK